ncbi:MAG TPA: ABC transporter substrate-binding protein [Anaeromyxobacteraceae bacterium]|nr:ABC transporter substrate-binding protein [Anaeromyxobacteraceae bacterium]
MSQTTVRWLALITAALATPGALAEEQPIKIGALLAVTGPAAFLGGPEANTLQMLVDETNARGGIRGRKVQLLVKDTGASPEKAISFAKQLIEEERVFAIIGPATSGETMAVKAIAEEAKTLLLSCAAAEVIVQPVAPHVFKTAQKDSHAAIKIFQQMQKMKITRIGVLTSNTGFGKAGKEQIEKLAPQYGIQIAASEIYDKAATDLTAEVTKMKAAKVDAILNWSIEPAQAIAIKNIRQLGLTIPIFQSHGFGNVAYATAAGAAAEGVLFPAGRLHVADQLAAGHPQRAVLVSYRTAYESRFKEDASGFGGYAHDAFLILKNAIEKTGGTDPEKVRAAIETTKGLVGASGTFNFSPVDHNGLDLDAFEMLTVKNGHFTPLAR